MAALATMSIAACPAEVTPAVATVMAFGLAFMPSISSAAVWYGCFGFTARTGILATLRNSSQSMMRAFTEPSDS